MDTAPSRFTGFASFSEDPDSVIKHTKEHARKGDADDVIRVIDEYCWKTRALMNVGDVKGAILDKIFKECNPTVAIELGSFLGYSAVRMARLLKPGGKLFAMEIDPHHSELVRDLADFAGVGEKVSIITGSTETTISSLKGKYGIPKIDFVFIDHEKSLYKPDMIRLIETGLFQKGTVVVADNIISHSINDYLEFVRNHPKFTSELFESQLEYTPELKDGLEKSVYLG